MFIRLKRFSYGRFETEGRLVIGDQQFATIEQPWNPNPNGAKGGKPFESCVPDGMYQLAPHKRPNGDHVFIFWNPELGVYRLPQDHKPGHGRNLCLLHKGNWALDVQGCVAPGIYRKAMDDRRTKWDIDQAVAKSANAMARIRELLSDKPHLLAITNECGATDG